MSIFQVGNLICPRCRKRVTRLYPVTWYDPASKHWVPGRACLPCCGPSREATEIMFTATPRYKPVQR